MNVYNQGHRPDSNWDNVIDAPAARTQTAQLATTGVPRQLDLQFTSVVTNVLNGLPPEPWPFALDNDKALAGREVFDRNCIACHRPGNPQRYGQVGTDLNRYRQFNAFTWEATRRALRATCPADTLIAQTFGEGMSKPCTFASSRILRPTVNAPSNEQGYGATALHGLWTSSPYFHNGSVLTLAEVLAPRLRRARYVRGASSYDPLWVGWKDAQAAGLDEQLIRGFSGKFNATELLRRYSYDTSLSGLSARGHDRDLVLDGKTLRLNYDTDFQGEGSSAQAKAGSEAEALLEFLKTL